MNVPDQYLPWLKAYLVVTAADAILLKMDDATFYTSFQAAYDESLHQLMAQAGKLFVEKQEGFNPDELILLLAFVRRCEDQLLDERDATLRILAHPRCEYAGREYVALNMPAVLLRSPAKPKRALKGIPASGMSQPSAVKLGLRFLWCRTDRNLRFSFGRAEELTWPLPESGTVRFGVASWVNDGEVPFDSAVQHPFADNARWARCRGPQPPDDAKQRMEKIVELAIRHEVNVLIFPELTMSPELLRALSDLLDSKSEPHKLYLIIAGSMHEPTPDGKYVNRSTAISGMGVVLWSQDKCATFDMLDRGIRYFEPQVLGTSLSARESETLGRIAVVICSDFCNEYTQGRQTDLWKLLVESRTSLVLVPAMQHDGELEKFVTAAKGLRNAHWASSIVSNIQVPDVLKTGFERSSFVWAADTRDSSRPVGIPLDTMNYLEYFDLQPISSLALVNYKLGD